MNLYAVVHMSEKICNTETEANAGHKQLECRLVVEAVDYEY